MLSVHTVPVRRHSLVGEDYFMILHGGDFRNEGKACSAARGTAFSFTPSCESGAFSVGINEKDPAIWPGLFFVLSG